MVLRGVEEVEELLPMEGPESANSLALCLLAQFDDGELFTPEALGKFRKRQQLNQLVALHDIVLLDATPLGELLEVHKGQR
jgi:hypothetical protein